jgi:hypothetical protein
MFTPHVDAIADALISAFAVARDAKLREEAEAGAIPYQVDHVIDTYWRPALDLVAEATGRKPAAQETIVSSLENVR